MQIDPTEYFTEVCPTCKGKMAKGNDFCRLDCYKNKT